MSENHKYYYLKLKDNFFDSEEMKLLDTMKNGKDYQILYLKLCLLSLKNDGALMFKGMIPYDFSMISTITNMSIDTVKTALELFKKIGLVTVTDTGTIYMSDIQLLIGQSTTEAERQQKYRQRITNDVTNVTTNVDTNVQQLCNKSSNKCNNKSTTNEHQILEIDIRDKRLDSPKPSASDVPPEAATLSQLLVSLHKTNIDSKYNPTDKQIDKWAADIEKLNRLDGRSWHEIESVIRWVKTSGNFWAPNIMSGSKLRDKFPTLTAQMNRPETGHSSYFDLTSKTETDPIRIEQVNKERMNFIVSHGKNLNDFVSCAAPGYENAVANYYAQKHEEERQAQEQEENNGEAEY